MLIGVGLGPGDPELMTLRAIKTLKESIKTFVPGRLAYDLVSPYTDAEILDFPMTGDEEILKQAWETNADLIAGIAKDGTVSFGVMGDPNFFSTFTHLKRVILEKYPSIQVTTIPGISSITAFASKSNVSIDNSFIVSDGSNIGHKIVLKARKPREEAGKLEKENFNDFLYIRRLFMEGELVTRNIPEKGDYFSMLYACKKNREKSDQKMQDKKVYFVGAGPGNPKLITVKGKELLESADIVIYAGSLVNQDILNFSSGKKIDSHGLDLEEIIDIMAGGVRKGKVVVRLHSGDPSLYGAVIEQVDALKKRNIDAEIVPGVSSLFASAASLKTQLTVNGITDTVIITRPAGTTLESDIIAELSKHNATLAIFLGTHKIREITGALSCPPDTPAAVVYHASWDDEQVLKGTVADIADKVERAGLKRSAIILIGNVLEPEDYVRSHLYGEYSRTCNNSI